MRSVKFPVAIFLVVTAAWVGGCGKSETYNVTISYVLEPTQKLPEGLTTLAILDAGVETKEGDTEDKDRSVKWATIAADMMEKMIQDSALKFGSGLTVAKRRDTTKVMAEKDMKMAGLVDGGAAAQAAKLLEVQGIIASKLNIRVEVKEGKSRTVSAASIAAWGGRHWGGGSGSVDTEEVSNISRNMTVQCSFSLMDATTGEAIFQFSPKPFRKFDNQKPGPVFGSSKTEADLDSVDGIIGELVEQGTREFVSMFVPCEVEYAYQLESGKSEESARGVRLLRSDDLEGAMQSFKAALAEDPEDHRSAFAMGVASEFMKNWDDALKYYRQASGMPNLSEEEQNMYLAAKNRVTEHKDRIRKGTK
ncbi:MAG TPA: hypothetical protein VLM89_02645 [Phycisphaerae bacterium]|nr:hypothetical protein [Phycisphaerae bacterium]